MSVIEDFYNRNAATEWERLTKHRTEFAVTLLALEEFLPKPPATILEIGGGPGRYAIALTQRGYTVTLTDLAQANLDVARHQAEIAGVTLHKVLRQDALHLNEISSAQYAAVLMMGPLYHLLTIEERLQAIGEAKRALQPGGLIFAAFCTRFAPLRDCAADYPEWLADHADYLAHLSTTGVQDVDVGGFTNAYFAHPDEIIPLLEAQGFVTLSLIGCEGIVAGHEAKVNTLTGEVWEKWVRFNYKLGKEPALRGAADHLLYVGRRAERTSGS
jgi:S-adenosylmethionine-dependent methyltransferase